jgi:hypothetical protein
MASAVPSPTPNPNAMKFTLDRTLAESVFGVNDFVTISRTPGADWDPIVAAVLAAAERHL